MKEKELQTLVEGNKELMEILDWHYIYGKNVIRDGEAFDHSPEELLKFVTWRDKAVKEARVDELDKTIEAIKKRADNVTPNLLLNETVNYKYDRLKELSK